MGFPPPHGASLSLAIRSGAQQARVSQPCHAGSCSWHWHLVRSPLTIELRYLSNSLGDSAVIRDCAFLYETLPGLAACGSATSFDVDECMRLMCEHASAAFSAAVSAIMPVPQCFEVFAADFIVGSCGRPWLLEVRCCSCALASRRPSLFDFQVNADPSWALWQHEQPVLQASFRVVAAKF